MLPAMASCEPAYLRRLSLFFVEFNPLGEAFSPLPIFLPPNGLGVTLMTSLRLGRFALVIKGLDVGEPFWKALPI